MNTFSSSGYLNPSLKWRTAKIFSIDDFDIRENIDYHTLSWDSRAIDLDTVVDDERVVTGIRFKIVDSHIRIEVRFTDFDYKTGKLVDIEQSKWMANNEAKKMLELQYPDRSTRTPHKSEPIRGKNHFIQFQPSDIYKDAAQSTGDHEQ